MDYFWQTTLPDFSKLKQNLNVDVLVIGGGITGLLCAEYLQRAGLSGAVAEANKVAEGVSGRTTAKITSQHGVIYHKIERKYGLEAARQARFVDKVVSLRWVVRNLARFADDLRSCECVIK